MTPNMQMEQLSMAYIRAVAADAGCQIAEPVPDVDGIDGVLMATHGRRPRIDFQAKATYQDVLRDDGLHFRLPVHNYNQLRADTRTPRILIVLLMPEDRSEWLYQSNGELCLRHCAYWLSLEGCRPMSNQSNVTVRLPATNVFNSQQLNDLMLRAERGDTL